MNAKDKALKQRAIGTSLSPHMRAKKKTVAMAMKARDKRVSEGRSRFEPK